VLVSSGFYTFCSILKAKNREKKIKKAVITHIKTKSTLNIISWEIKGNHGIAKKG